MAGTLGATITRLAPQAVAAAFSAGGALDTAASSTVVNMAAAFTTTGTLAPTARPGATRSAALSASGAITITYRTNSVKALPLTATGVLAATVVNNFTPYTDTGTTHPEHPAPAPGVSHVDSRRR